MRVTQILRLIVVVSSIAGCGRAEQGSRSGAQPGSAENIQTMELTVAAIPPMTSGPIIIPPTPNPYPVLEGNTVIITSDAYFSRHPPANRVQVGQQVRITRPGNRSWGYAVTYDSTLLLPAPSMDLNSPPKQGWLWSITRKGTTTITITEVRQPCTDPGCPGDMPPRTIKVELDITQ